MELQLSYYQVLFQQELLEPQVHNASVLESTEMESQNNSSPPET